MVTNKDDCLTNCECESKAIGPETKTNARLSDPSDAGAT